MHLPENKYAMMMKLDTLKTEERSNMRILLIDDNLVFLSTLERFLNRHTGMQVSNHFQNASHAIDWLALGNEVDLIILDLDMPGLHGFDALPRLREIADQTPVVVLSMLDSSHEKRAAITAGAVEFVSKNHMLTDLIPTLERYHPFIMS